MTDRTVAEKLRVAAGDRLVVETHAEGQRELLEPLPDRVEVVALADAAGPDAAGPDAAVLFAADRASLDALLKAGLPVLGDARAVWIAYPKGNRTDINRDSIWRRVEELGWTLTANVSLDEVWSAVRGKRAG